MGLNLKNEGAGAIMPDAASDPGSARKAATPAMHANWPRRLYAPLALAASGAAFSVLAVVDKIYGVVQRPLHLATVAYALLSALLAWACVRGIQVKPSRLLRLSVYAGFLILNVLTAAYVFAWRVSADPTPVLLKKQLEQGDALLDGGKKDEAHLVYREAGRRFPDSFQVLMRLGAVNYQTGDYPRSQKYFERALNVAPSDSRWRALNDLGQAYWKLEQPEEAIQLYQQARQEGMPEDRPVLVEWHYRLAWAYFDAKDYDAAIEHYEAVAQADEKYVDASYYNAACAQAQKVKRTTDPLVREAVRRDAVANLERAWMATTSWREMEALREGIMGTPEQRDPELEPLRSAPEFQAFVRELRSR